MANAIKTHNSYKLIHLPESQAKINGSQALIPFQILASFSRFVYSATSIRTLMESVVYVTISVLIVLKMRLALIILLIFQFGIDAFDQLVHQSKTSFLSGEDRSMLLLISINNFETITFSIYMNFAMRFRQSYIYVCVTCNSNPAVGDHDIHTLKELRKMTEQHLFQNSIWRLYIITLLLIEHIQC